MKESFECDVVVVGAGLSGLSAAYYLAKKDGSLRIAVLEAKDRIGGRTLTKQLNGADGSKDFWDLGGEWIGRPQPHIQYLIKKFEVNVFNPVSPHSGVPTSDVNTLSWQTYLDLWQFKWKARRLQGKFAAINSGNLSHATYLDGILLEDYMHQQIWTSEAKSIVDAACHCMFGLMPQELTLLYFLKNVDSAGGLDTFIRPESFRGGEFRVKGGTQQLCYHLVKKIRKQNVYLSQPVTQIVQTIEGARVSTLNGLHILCQRVIIAIPPHHAASIDHQPPLPPTKLQWLQSIPLAFLIKFTISYETAFWKKGRADHGRSFQAVLSDPKMGPIGLVYDATSGRGNPALSGFISQADKMDPDLKNRRCFILCLIEQHVGSLCQDHLEFSQMDWSTEPYNGGCFLKNFIPETFTYFNNDMREPFDRLHFAGTETATVWCGFMNGAVQSGFRAGSEVLYHLRPLIAALPYPSKEKKAESHLRPDNRHSFGWFKFLAVGVGCAAGIYLMAKNSRVSSHGDTFVRHIKLVFDPNSY